MDGYLCENCGKAIAEDKGIGGGELSEGRVCNGQCYDEFLANDGIPRSERKAPEEPTPVGGWDAFKWRLLKAIEEQGGDAYRAGEAGKALDGERTGPYLPLPPFNLICAACGMVCRPIAHDTGDGWHLSLDCECQAIIEAGYFDWPKGTKSFKGSELEALGFEIV